MYKKQNFINKLASNDSKGFWKGFKALKRCTNVNSCHNVSGKSDNNDICERFKNYFIGNFVDSWNYNSFCDKLKNSEYDMLQAFMVSNCSVFSTVQVLGAVSNLGFGKVSGCDGLCAEAIKYCNPCIIPVLQFLFDACRKHGFVTRNVCSGKITPVPNKNGVCSKFEKFCPITTVNTVGKIFQYRVLSRLKTCVKFHELQLGFTTGGRCDKAVHVVSSVVEYFN